jgi:hypothetical protein
MKIKKIMICDIIREAAEAKHINDTWALQGLLDFLLEEEKIPLDRLQRSAERSYGIPAKTFYETVEALGYYEYRN